MIIYLFDNMWIIIGSLILSAAVMSTAGKWFPNPGYEEYMKTSEAEDKMHNDTYNRK